VCMEEEEEEEEGGGGSQASKASEGSSCFTPSVHSYESACWGQAGAR
jgi:hypothetical protein